MNDMIQAFIKAKKDLGEKLKECGKEAIADMAKPIFAANPKLLAFGWMQYTPYFNDGDPCVFSSYHCDIGKWRETPEQWEGMEAPVIRDDAEEEDQAIIDANKFEPGSFADFALIPDEVMLAVFGDHVEVVVKRDGSIEVSEYFHD